VFIRHKPLLHYILAIFGNSYSVLDPSWGKWQDGIGPVQGLNGGLFIDAENSGVLGRV
jgi:hypothetical protein